MIKYEALVTFSAISFFNDESVTLLYNQTTQLLSNQQLSEIFIIY